MRNGASGSASRGGADRSVPRWIAPNCIAPGCVMAVFLLRFAPVYPPTAGPGSLRFLVLTDIYNSCVWPDGNLSYLTVP